MVGVVILASMRGQFRGQLHSVAEPAAEPEAAGQLARIWHNWEGFQFLDLIITDLKSYMSCYNSMPLIGWNYNIQTREQIL